MVADGEMKWVFENVQKSKEMSYQILIYQVLSSE
jgi:hypothetical protein